MEREGYLIGDLELDVGAVSLRRRDGERLELPELSFELLLVLARRAPDVVPADELIVAVWKGTAVADETLTQRVALVRRVLGDDARRPRYLRSVRGRGYQLVPEVVPLHRAPHLAEAVLDTTRRTRLVTAGAVVAALAMSAVVVAALLSRRPTKDMRSTVADEGPAVATQPPTVSELVERAGVYLRRHRDEDNELAVELYRRVLETEPEDPQALAGLALALAQRTTKFNHPYQEAERAAEIARRAIELDPGSARAHLALGLSLDARGRVSEALVAYQRAADLDPRDPSARASAAYLLEVRGDLAAALEANLHAVRDGGGSPYLEVQIAAVLARLGYDEAAETWYRRALEMRPDNVFAAASFSRLRIAQGRLQEADALAAEALERGIRRPELALVRGDVALLRGDRRAARRFYEHARELRPELGGAANRLLVLDRLESEDPRAATLEARYRGAVAAIRRGRREGDQWPDAALEEAVLHIGFGHPAEALEALDVAIASGYRDAAWLLRDPLLHSLQELPAFRRRIAEIEERVERERQRVADAPWLPPSLLDATAARR